MFSYVGLLAIFLINLLQVATQDTPEANSCDARRATESLPSACENAEIEPPEGNYDILDCETLNGNECLCDLSGNCRYHSKSQTCKMITDCSKYRNRPTLCRAKHCVYDCPTQSCLFGDSAGYTVCEEDPSVQKCGDICTCKMEGCDFTSSGSCHKPQGSCLDSAFQPGECGRPNSFYIHNGVVCHNLGRRGVCSIKETVFAVNVGGKSYTDSNGIAYKADAPELYIDDYQIRAEYKLGKQPDFSPDQKKLYKTVIYAHPHLRENGRCLIYPIPVCKDGTYELVIKTIETFDVKIGEKAFNIRFGGLYVFPEVGLVKLTGKTMVPIDLILNFKIYQGILMVAGQPPSPIVDSTIDLEFCYGECIFLEGAFQVAAFAVNKLGTNQNDEMHSKSCKLFHNEHWNCVENDCHYNHETGECEDQYSKECDWSCDSKPKLPPAEVLFMLDSTHTGRGFAESPAKAKSKVFDEFQRIKDVVDILVKMFKNIRFGLSLFSDVSCHRDLYVDQKACEKIWPKGPLNDVEEGCYRTLHGLTKDIKAFKDSGRRDKLTFVTSHDYEPGMFAATLAVGDRAMQWSPKNNTRRLIVIITDDGLRTFKFAEEDLKDPKFDGTDTCRWMKYPDPEPLGKVFNSRSIALLLLGERNDARQSYESFINKMKIKYDYLSISAKNDEIAAKIVNLLTM